MPLQFAGRPADTGRKGRSFLTSLSLALLVSVPPSAHADFFVEGHFDGTEMVLFGGLIEGTFRQWFDPRGVGTESRVRMWDIQHGGPDTGAT